MTRPRILSGMRPTGPLHIGHLTGALDNWVRLMDTYECFFAIVDSENSNVRVSTKPGQLQWRGIAIRSGTTGTVPAPRARFTDVLPRPGRVSRLGLCEALAATP